MPESESEISQDIKNKIIKDSIQVVEFNTFLDVLIEKLSLKKSLQWQDDPAVSRPRKFRRDIVLDNLVQFCRKYEFYLFNMVNEEEVDRRQKAYLLDKTVIQNWSKWFSFHRRLFRIQMAHRTVGDITLRLILGASRKI